MDLFYKPHKDILQKMLFFNVEFIMIGGYAVNYQGFSRPTGDLELWIKPTNDNKEKLLEMLKVNKFNKESIEYINSVDFTKPEVFCMGEPPTRIDFLTKITGFEYEVANKEKIIEVFEGMNITSKSFNTFKN
jgi:hypothetical protein